MVECTRLIVKTMYILIRATLYASSTPDREWEQDHVEGQEEANDRLEFTLDQLLNH